MAEQSPEVKEGKIYAVLAYLGILCLIPLLLKKDNKFVLFHAKQGLVIFIGGVIATALGIIPFLGWAAFGILHLVFAGISIIGIIKALCGEYWEIPVVADFAKKINI